jgi:ABC-2 type transport system permease protein
MNKNNNNSLIDLRIIAAMARKELKSYFDQPAAYVLLLIFTGLSLFFFFQYESVSKEASLRIYFDLLPWFFLFFIPAITMRSFSEEYRAGTIETMLTKPVSNLDVILGKFLGSYLFAIVPLVLSLVLLISIAGLGKLDYGVVAGQYFGALMLAAAFTALGMWMSSLTKNQIASLIGSVAVGFLFMILNTDVVTTNLPQSVTEVFNQLSFSSHMTSISRGVIDVRDLVFFGGFITLFLLLCYISLNKWLDYVSDKRFTYLAVALICIIALLNVAAMKMPLRLDLTKDKTYTMSKATVDIINGAKGPIDITVYASAQLPPQMQLISRDIWDMLNDYKRIAGNKITINRYDPSSDQKAAEEATSKGVHPVQFNVYSNSEIKVNKGYFGLVISKGVESESIPFIQAIDDFEFQVSSGIAKVTRTKMPTIAVVTGHGEGTPSNGYGLFGQELRKIVGVDELEINDDMKEIPANYDLLMFLGPKTRDISKHEAKIIDEFVRSGHAAIFAHDGVNINTQSMTAKKNEALFSELYKKWGVELLPELAYDLESNVPVTASNSISQVLVPYPYFIEASVDQSKPVAKKVESILTQWASPIDILERDNKGISALVTTSSNAGLTSDNFELNPMNAQFSSKALGKEVLGVQLKISKGYALIIGDSDFLSDGALGQLPQNSSLVLNALDYYTGGKGLSEIKSKQAATGILELKSADQYETLRIGNIVAACAVIIILGAYRLTKRMKRKNMYYGEYPEEDLEGNDDDGYFEEDDSEDGDEREEESEEESLEDVKTT